MAKITFQATKHIVYSLYAWYLTVIYVLEAASKDPYLFVEIGHVTVKEHPACIDKCPQDSVTLVH